MGEEVEDPQKLKKMAAAAYDYDNDPRWADYWSNVLVPPNMASRSDVINYYKSKFYQRYIDPDLIVEPMASGSTSQPAASSTTHSYTSRTTGTFTTPAPNSTSLRWDGQTIQFSVNAWIFVVAVLAIFPLLPKNLSKRAFRLSFMGTACSSLYSLYSLYGVVSSQFITYLILCMIYVLFTDSPILVTSHCLQKPRAWNLQALQVWFQSVAVTKNFIYSIYCLTFVTSNLCLKFALIPILCLSLQHVAKFLRRNFSRSTLYRKYLEEACVWVDSNTTTLSILSSQAEIGLGFLLIISLFSWQRNVIQAFMYWQLLKLMYQAPATAGYHQSAWARIGRIINPLIRRYAPFLNTPITAIQKWWFR
ncbi:transmembrane 33 homolog [Olea europaea subsp. europaea]|uniref:Transmembrane 33 homolog n=1 Tax=Olea europaea subsp. europaea TaxID=158383 RepID=A0A8S0T401_OLEEU|nr:transmembrane 33 homolog [Olea europaea subsp. europaea]